MQRSSFTIAEKSQKNGSFSEKRQLRTSFASGLNDYGLPKTATNKTLRHNHRAFHRSV